MWTRGLSTQDALGSLGRFLPFPSQSLLWSTQKSAVFSSLFITSLEQCLCLVKRNGMLSRSLPAKPVTASQFFHLAFFQVPTLSKELLCPLGQQRERMVRGNLADHLLCCALMPTANPVDPISVVMKPGLVNISLSWGKKRSFNSSEGSIWLRAYVNVC